MTTHKEALTLALEALTATMSTHGFKDAIEEVQDKAITAIKEALAQPEQEPVVLRFNEWTVSKNDLSDYICVGELTLASIEDNLEGPEFGEVEIERFDAVIEALQEKLVTGRECKKVPLIAYIGANNTTPPQRKPLTDEQKDAARWRWLSWHIKVAWNEGKFTSLVRIVSDKDREALNASIDRMMAGDWSDAEAAHGIKE